MPRQVRASVPDADSRAAVPALVERPGTRALLEILSPDLRPDRTEATASSMDADGSRWIACAITRSWHAQLQPEHHARWRDLMFAFAPGWRCACRGCASRVNSADALGSVTKLSDTDSRDELGDVARGFSTLLQRLNEYTSYLRTPRQRLAPKIRTPLTMVLPHLSPNSAAFRRAVRLDRWPPVRTLRRAGSCRPRAGAASPA